MNDLLTAFNVSLSLFSLYTPPHPPPPLSLLTTPLPPHRRKRRRPKSTPESQISGNRSSHGLWSSEWYERKAAAAAATRTAATDGGNFVDTIAARMGGQEFKEGQELQQGETKKKKKKKRRKRSRSAAGRVRRIARAPRKRAVVRLYDFLAAKFPIVDVSEEDYDILDPGELRDDDWVCDDNQMQSLRRGGETPACAKLTTVGLGRVTSDERGVKCKVRDLDTHLPSLSTTPSAPSLRLPPLPSFPPHTPPPREFSLEESGRSLQSSSTTRGIGDFLRAGSRPTKRGLRF